LTCCADGPAGRACEYRLWRFIARGHASDHSCGQLLGKGEDDPAVPNNSEANRKKTRRVVIVFDKR
jgi:flagellar motor protein MotB